jgi:Skp family chaperone for outer membrane proteins
MIFRPCLVAIVFLVSFSVFLSAQTASKPYATVNGETITEEQVMRAAAADLKELEAKRAQNPSTYDRDKLVILHKALDGIIEDKLIAAEALRDKMTKEQIIFAEIDSNVATHRRRRSRSFTRSTSLAFPRRMIRLFLW